MTPLLPGETEILAGLEMGGIPIATALSFETGLSVVFVRKTAKAYGTAKFTEGRTVEGKKLCIIEDVITTGGTGGDECEGPARYRRDSRKCAVCYQPGERYHFIAGCQLEFTGVVRDG